MTLVETLIATPPPLQMDPGGALRVGRTRVTLDTVVGAFEEGATPEEIVLQYDSLHLADVYAVISHYLRHRSEVEAYLNRRAQQAGEIRLENARRFPSAGIRERLLARRSQQS